MKRLLAPLAALVLALALSAGALAAEVYIHGYFIYTVEDQSVTVTAYTGKEAEVTVPAMIGGSPVNTIAAGAFADNDYVKTVHLPDTVTTVEEGAFGPGQTVIFFWMEEAEPSPGETPEPSSEVSSESLAEPAQEPSPEPTPESEAGSSEDSGVEDVEIGIPYGSIGSSVGGSTPAPAAPPANPAAPSEDTADPAKGPEVQVSTQHVTVDGEKREIEHYNIDGNNYFKLRDLACILMGTPCAFDVSYDEATRHINLTTGGVYSPLDTDLQLGEDKSDSAVVSTQPLYVNGEPVSLRAFNIGGDNYFKLRDLAPYLGFGVDYDEATRTAQILTRD